MKKAAVATVLVLCAGAWAAEKTYKDDAGRLRVRPATVAAEFNNPWPAAWEDGFATRADHYLKYWSTQKLGCNTWGENEKRGYPSMMWAYLLGHKDQAVKAFEADDVQRNDHAHTEGVDFYWCFTLKGQMRKYFYFGDALSAAYREKFRRGAKTWTGQDPLHRPHPYYGKGGKGGMWGPDNKGSWVDVRGTDNLRAMRDTSVYLMAELTGNEAVRKLARDRIQAYVRMLYCAGMMEWDSCNYHAHTLAPYHNLYDFAKDPEVKKLAKAALDWLYAAAAVKYWRGGFGGPNNRDYGGSNVVFGAGAVKALWLYFGDSPTPCPESHYDDVHHITSPYRPPAAVVELARKNFPRPVEILATKPYYKLWDGQSEITPQYYETQYFGRTFQMGSAVSREPMQPWTPSMFKLMACSAKRGVDYILAATYVPGGHARKFAGDQIGQYRNLLIWLRPGGKEPRTFHFQIPRTARQAEADGVWFVGLDKTYVAIRPIALGTRAEYRIPQHTDQIDKRTKKPKPNPRYELYKDERFFRAEAGGDGYFGFAMEVGEAGDYADLAAFRKAVRSKGKVDVSGLGKGAVTLTGSDGKKLTLRHNAENDLPGVGRDAVVVDYAKRQAVYGPTAKDQASPIHQDYMSGTLTVEAGGKRFACSVTRDGKVTWTNADAK